MIVRELIATFGIEVDPKGFKQAESQINSFGNKVKGFINALGAAYVANGIKNFVQEQINAADEIYKAAQRIGVSAKFLQEYSFAAKLAGIDQASFNQSLGFFTRQLGAAASGSQEAKDALKSLGVTDFKNTENAILQLADGLEKIPTQTQKANRLAKVFGKTGANLFNLFKGGRKEIERTIERFKRLGGAIDQDTLKQSEEFNDNLTVLGYALKAIANSFIKEFLPNFTKFTDNLIKGAEVIIGFVKQSNILTATFIALGIAMTPVALKALAIIAPFVILALLIDDLITLFEGGDSLIGEFIDNIFGVGSAAKTVEVVKKAFDDFLKALPVLIETVTNAWGFFVAVIEDSGIIDTLGPLFKAFLDLASVISSILFPILKVIGKFIGYYLIAYFIILTNALKKAFDFISFYISGTAKEIKSLKDKFESFIGFIKKGAKLVAGAFGFELPDFLKDPVSVKGVLDQSGLDPNGQSMLGPIANNQLKSSNAGAFNNTSNNKVNITINADSSSNADDIASKSSEAVRKMLEEERRVTFESWRQVAPSGAM